MSKAINSEPPGLLPVAFSFPSLVIISYGKFVIWFCYAIHELTYA